MTLDREDIRQISRLAHLELDQETERAMVHQLGSIVDAFSLLERFETFEEATPASPDPDAIRSPGKVPGTSPSTTPHTCLDRTTVLANAPCTTGEYFAVPRMLASSSGDVDPAEPPGAEAIRSSPDSPQIAGGAAFSAAPPARDAIEEREAPPWTLSAATIARRVAGGELTAETVVESCRQRIERVEPSVGAFLRLYDEAREQAAAIDRRRREGKPLGPLAGVPVAIKDNLALRGRPMTCGSRMLERFVAPYDATAVERLLAADAIVLGATNLDEFAMGSSCESSAYALTRNPWNLDRVPGGSSGGSAAAVAGHGVPLALGSDTGGSIRQPAAFCGISGLLPTRGRVSRYGLTAFASSFDQVGPLARDCRDLALALGVIAGHDPRDATSSHRPTSDFGAELEHGVDTLRCGVITELAEVADPEMGACFDRALDRLRSSGAEISSITIPHAHAAIACYYVVAAAEASSNLARFDGIRYGYRARGGELGVIYRRSRGLGLGAEVKRRILLGTFALSAGHAEAWYRRARGVGHELRRQLDEALETYDVLLAPTAPSAAFALGERFEDPLTMYSSDFCTLPASLAGLPALSLPCGRDSHGMPLGLQIIGRRFAEPTVLRTGRAFEHATAWRVEPDFGSARFRP